MANPIIMVKLHKLKQERKQKNPSKGKNRQSKISSKIGCSMISFEDIVCLVSLLTRTKLILKHRIDVQKGYTKSECTSTTFGLSKHHVFGFIDFGSKVMATTSIWMICNHHSPMCFFNLISWSGRPAIATIQNQISAKNMKKFMANTLSTTRNKIQW